MTNYSSHAQEAQPLQAPTNTATKRLFVAATRMNDGKTTTCLGLFAALKSHFSSIGFIKPVGQRFIRVGGHVVDEDSYLLDRIYDVRVPIESMSPVAVDPTFTRRYLDDPANHATRLVDTICRAFDRVSWEKDFTLIEGTGHAGVGSVFNLSNARVARLLQAKAIIVTEGGIGRPVDEIALSKALFDQEGVEVIGAILNKVLPEKIPAIREYAARGLRLLGVPLLGVLPAQKVLSSPSIGQVAATLDAEWINGRLHGAGKRVLRVVIGAMTAKGLVDYLQPGVLVITPGDRDDILLAAIAGAGMSGRQVVSGIVLTQNVRPHPRLLEMLARTSIPVIAARDDSYTVASRIHGMTVKTQPEDADKIPLIRRLIQENVKMDHLLASF